MRNIIVFNGYPLSVFLAVGLHALVLALLLYMQRERAAEVLDLVRPPMVKALLVDENPQARNEQKQEQQRLARLEDQRRQAAEQQRQQEQADAERARQEQQAQQQRERDAAAERERRQQETEQQRQRELAEEQERQRRQETERQRQQELAAEQERQRQQEESAQAAAEAARTESELVMAYTAVIHDLVQQNWSRPPSARNGMEVVIRLRMVPTGDVLEVEIVRSSGDPAFDRAAETAIFRVGQFRELQGMPITMFNTNFRSLLLTFRPEDLLN